MGGTMTKQLAIDQITARLPTLEEEQVLDILEFIETISAESVLPRPLTEEELGLLEQSRQDFREGRTMTMVEAVASIDEALAKLGVPKSRL